MTRCPDCTVNHCSGKRFYDLGGKLASVGWTCMRCGNKWLVVHARRLPWYRRMLAWVLAPIVP